MLLFLFLFMPESGRIYPKTGSGPLNSQRLKSMNQVMASWRVEGGGKGLRCSSEGEIKGSKETGWKNPKSSLMEADGGAEGQTLTGIADPFPLTCSPSGSVITEVM